MKEIKKTTEEARKAIAEAIAHLNGYRSADAARLASEEEKISAAEKSFVDCKDEAKKPGLKLNLDTAIAQYNATASLIVAKSLNAAENPVDVFLNGNTAGQYEARKFSRGKVVKETVYLTATAWNAINNGLRDAKKTADEDPEEKKKTIALPKVVPDTKEFQNVLEVIEALAVKSLDFINSAPTVKTSGTVTVKAVTEKVNDLAKIITGKDEELFTWVGRAVITFSATYAAKKRIVKGAKDSDYINLIFDLIRQKRNNVDKMSFTSKASAFKEKN